MADSVGSKHILTALSSVNSGSLPIPSGDPKFFSVDRRAVSVRQLYHIFYLLSSSSSNFLKKFLSRLFSLFEKYFYCTTFLGVCQEKNAAAAKNFFTYFFLDPAGFFGVCQVFFQKQEKIFCQVKFSLY